MAEEQVDPREIFGDVFMKDVERLVRELDPKFREQETSFFLGWMTVYQDGDGCRSGYVGLSPEKVYPLSVTRWNPPVGENRLVMVLPCRGKQPPKAIPLGATSAEAREAAKLCAAEHGFEVSIDPLPLTEWDPRNPRYVVVQATGKNRRDEYTTRINGKLAIFKPSKDWQPSKGVDILCRIENERFGVVHLVPLPQYIDDSARTVYDHWNQAPNDEVNLYLGLKAHAVRKRPHLSGTPFAALGLGEDADLKQVRGAEKKLNDANFADETAAAADPMFAAMRASEFNGSWVAHGGWWKDLDFLDARKQYLREARDAAVKKVRARPALAEPVQSERREPPRKRIEIADPYAALGIATDAADKDTVRAHAKELRDKVFASDEEAAADPMFAAMRAAGFEGALSDARSVSKRRMLCTNCANTILDAIDVRNGVDPEESRKKRRQQRRDAAPANETDSDVTGSEGDAPEVPEADSGVIESGTDVN